MSPTLLFVSVEVRVLRVLRCGHRPFSSVGEGCAAGNQQNRLFGRGIDHGYIYRQIYAAIVDDCWAETIVSQLGLVSKPRQGLGGCRG